MTKVIKKVISVKNDAPEFERQINLYEGFATQISTCMSSTDIFYTAVIFLKE